MSLNLTGSYFGNNDFGHSQQNATNIMETGHKAILYVFKPYHNQFGDVGLRPFQYHFDENFVAETQQINDLSKRGTAQASSLISNLRSSTNLNDHMLPSFQSSMMLNSSRLSDRHRFILILTEKANSLISGNTLVSSDSNSQVRRIYTGFFEDEPFNPTTFSNNRQTLNPNSFMVITHKTIVGTSVDHGRLGARTEINTQSSEEIVNSQLLQSLIGRERGVSDGLFLMTPENCINSIDTNDDGYSIAVPGAHSDISRDQGNNIVADILEQPGHNVAQIVKGMIRFQDDVTHRSRLSTHKVDNYFENDFMDESMSRVKLGRYMSLPRSRKSSIFDLDYDSRISPADIDKMVNGDLQVVPFDLERPIYYETADQMETSVTNQYSFLIASVVVPILNSAGLNAMTFEYQIAQINGQIQEDFRTNGAEPNWPVPQNDLLSMAKAVEVELVSGILSTIFHSKGDFHVVVSANVTGMTIVRLSLVGQGYKNQVDFELPSCMGGLISPLIGDSSSNANNSEAIEVLYNVATGTNNISSNFNDDDRSFMNLAEDVSWKSLQNGTDIRFPNSLGDVMEID